MIFLHEIDWKIKMNNRHISLMLLMTLKIVSWLKNYCYHDHNNRHIVKLLFLPQSLYKHVLTELVYQLQLECDMYTISYKLQVPKWILIKSDEISGKHCKMKVQVYDCSSYHNILTTSETHHVFHNTTFSWVCCIGQEWCTSTAMYCVTMSPHFSN